jgi:outer membrane immunogenic protein
MGQQLGRKRSQTRRKGEFLVDVFRHPTYQLITLDIFRYFGWGFLMSRKFGWALASVVTLSIGAVGTALAADLPVKAPPVVAPVWNWTGFYVGGNVGGDWGRSNTNSPIANSGVCPACYIPSVITDINAQQAQTVNGSGFTGGAQAGYNYQVNRLVLGVEADINAFRVQGSTTTSAFFTGFPGTTGPAPTYTNSVSTNWLFTGRGRLGFAANNWLFYGTGGVAVTDLSYRHTFVEGVFPGTSRGTEISTASTDKVGYVVGAGFEYGWRANWSIKAEYLYLNFGSVGSTAAVIFPPATVGGSVFTHSANLSANIVRVGLNYRFGGPIVAKY